MPHESLLLGLAEVSVALTGFAGIVGFLGRRASGNWTEADRARFSTMISNGLRAVLFSLLPFLFWELSSNPQITWASSSGVGAVVGVFGVTTSLRRMPRIAAAGDAEANLLGGYAIAGVTGLIVLALGLNALGVIFERSFTPYLVALFWHLGLAGSLFLRLIRFS